MIQDAEKKKKKRQRKGSQKDYQNIIIIIHSIYPNKPWVEYISLSQH